MRLNRVGAATVALLFFYTLIDFLDLLFFDFESLLDPYEGFDLLDLLSDFDRLLHELLVLILSSVGDCKYKSLFGFVFYF